VTRRRLSNCACRIAAGTLAFVAVLGTTPTASATTTTGGGLLQASGVLPVFPCYPCPSNATLTGLAALSLSGLGTATLNGVPIPYSAAWPGAASTSNLTIGLSYNDYCTLTPAALQGDGTGNFALSGGVLMLGGGVLGNAVLTGTLVFTREGTAMRILLQDLTVTAGPNGATVAVSLNSQLLGASATGFVPLGAPGICASPQTNVSTILAGVALQPV
jgi:hypothetical protein